MHEITTSKDLSRVYQLYGVLLSFKLPAATERKKIPRHLPEGQIPSARRAEGSWTDEVNDPVVPAWSAKTGSGTIFQVLQI